MTTTVEKAIVEVTDDGWPKRYLYWIATKGDHQLMTRRLKKLMDGDIGLIARWGHDKHGDDRDSEHVMLTRDIRFIGMVWLKPYVLLDELIRDRLAKQCELAQLGDTSNLTRLPRIEVPQTASNQQITLMIQSELASREMIKRQIRKFEVAKAAQDCSDEFASAHNDCSIGLPPDSEGGGWLQP